MVVNGQFSRRLRSLAEHALQAEPGSGYSAGSDVLMHAKGLA
jgi:hypothetical protein